MADSDSDSDDLIDGSWSMNKRKRIYSFSVKKLPKMASPVKPKQLTEQTKRFDKLKAKSSEIMMRSSLRQYKTEIRRSQKLLKKVLKDPWIQEAVEKNLASGSKETETDDTSKWEDVKPFLSVNEHLHGAVSHGDCGPKTELEYQIEDCIKDGDFEEAELLSDTLADREFAVKISHAFAAKKYKEKQDEQNIKEEKKKVKKIRWMFDSKERWQMKGNM